MNLFNNIKDVDELKCHPKFLLLRNQPELGYEKKMLDRWTDGLIDKDKKFVREFQETFHSSFWEIYLYKLFTEAKFQIDQSHQMPDYVIKAPIEFYVEAVVANIKNQGRKEEERTIHDQLSMMIPPYLQNDFYILMNEAIIRAANAIKSKSDKYSNQYIKHEWVNPDCPFVIAMSSYD